MAQLTFTAHCAKGHDRLEFTDRAAFEAHMKGAHGKRKLAPGGASVTYSNPKGKAAPGWRAGKPEEPTPWKAPRPTAGGLEKVARDLTAGKYDLQIHDGSPKYSWGTRTETLRMGEVA